MGFPSRRARSRASNRAPGEILVEEWKGNDIEKALVSIHPERFDDVNQVALSTLFVIGNEVYGSRRNLGSNTLGVQLDKQTGDLGYTADEKGHHANTTLTRIVRTLGAIPEGFAEMPEPKQRQVNRQLKYACQTCGTIIRSAGTALETLCLHGGKPQHGQPGTPFVLQVPKAGVTQATQPAVASGGPLPAAPQAPQTQAEYVQTIAKLVKAGTVKVSHGRMFGQTESAPA